MNEYISMNDQVKNRDTLNYFEILRESGKMKIHKQDKIRKGLGIESVSGSICYYIAQASHSGCQHYEHSNQYACL